MQGDMDAVATILSSAAADPALQSSVRLARLMISAVHKYGDRLAKHKATLVAAAGKLTSFTAKQCIVRVGKLP